MTDKTRIDPFTGEAFEAKRRNQVFAKKQNRIDYHNEQAALLSEEKAPLNKPLHENLKILKSVMGGEKEARFHIEFMRGRGFSFKHSTHNEEYKGMLVHAVYGYMWFREKDEKGKSTDYIKIIKK